MMMKHKVLWNGSFYEIPKEKTFEEKKNYMKR